MSWDWAIDSFKAGILVLLTWGTNYLRKKALPFLKEFRRFLKLTEIVDRIDNEVGVLKSKQMASLHTDVHPIFIMNNEGEMIYANPAWCDMTGFTNVKDAYGKGYLKAIPPEDIEMIEKQNERLVEHPSSYEGEIRFRHIKTKEIINTICRSELVHGRNEVLVETVGRLFILKD